SRVQLAGMVFDGSSSACTDAGRFALAGLLAADGADLELLPFMASAAPAPAAAATTTAALVKAMVRPRPAGRLGGPPGPPEYCRARSVYGCDGPAYCAFGSRYWPYCAFELPPCLPYWPYWAFEPPYCGDSHGGWGLVGGPADRVGRESGDAGR